MTITGALLTVDGALGGLLLFCSTALLTEPHRQRYSGAALTVR